MENKLILYVEDNPRDLALVERIFTKEIEECELKHFYDAESSLDWLEDHSRLKRLPTLIILDLKLIGMSGLDLLKVIRTKRELKHVPTIIMSSSVEPRDVREAYKNRANSYIEKAKNYVDLKNTVKSLVFYWTRLNKNGYDRE